MGVDIEVLIGKYIVDHDCLIQNGIFGSVNSGPLGWHNCRGLDS